MLAIVKSKLKGDLKFREQVLRKEVVNYFHAKVGIDLTSDFFEPKLEANYDDPETIPTGISLVVHGVDFMDTRKVGDLFNIVGQDPRSFIHRIVWINDSNCEVIFFSPQNAMLALEQLMVDSN